MFSSRHPIITVHIVLENERGAIELREAVKIDRFQFHNVALRVGGNMHKCQAKTFKRKVYAPLGDDTDAYTDDAGQFAIDIVTNVIVNDDMTLLHSLLGSMSLLFTKKGEVLPLSLELESSGRTRHENALLDVFLKVGPLYSYLNKNRLASWGYILVETLSWGWTDTKFSTNKDECTMQHKELSYPPGSCLLCILVTNQDHDADPTNFLSLEMTIGRETLTYYMYPGDSCVIYGAVPAINDHKLATTLKVIAKSHTSWCHKHKPYLLIFYGASSLPWGLLQKWCTQKDRNTTRGFGFFNQCFGPTLKKNDHGGIVHSMDEGPVPKKVCYTPGKVACTAALRAALVSPPSPSKSSLGGEANKSKSCMETEGSDYCSMQQIIECHDHSFQLIKKCLDCCLQIPGCCSTGHSSSLVYSLKERSIKHFAPKSEKLHAILQRFEKVNEHIFVLHISDGRGRAEDYPCSALTRTSGFLPTVFVGCDKQIQATLESEFGKRNNNGLQTQLVISVVLCHSIRKHVPGIVLAQTVVKFHAEDGAVAVRWLGVAMGNSTMHLCGKVAADDKPWRQRGFSSFLLAISQLLGEQCYRISPPCLYVEVREDAIEALAFYRKLQFQRCQLKDSPKFMQQDSMENNISMEGSRSKALHLYCLRKCLFGADIWG